MKYAFLVASTIILFIAAFATLFAYQVVMFSVIYILPLFGLAIASSEAQSTNGTATNVSLSWHAPSASQINNLQNVLNGTGVYGFAFNGSQAASSNTYYGGYNWYSLWPGQVEFVFKCLTDQQRCNMPHVNTKTYPRATKEYELEYVEVIHRHHKRTPYASNTFPKESYPWYCSDEGLFYYGEPLNPPGNTSASTYWSVYDDPINPFAPQGFNGTCQFPQITRGGLDDSHQHGKDLYAVYHDVLNFLPSAIDFSVTYRVTNNVITSQVASMLVAAMYHPSGPFPLKIQPASIDSLEPTYSCPAASALYGNYGVGSTNPNWTAHLTASAPLFRSLDAISGVSPGDAGWHQSLDHYFDNLSARLCHAKPLPCNISNPTRCITQEMANQVFRTGEYEYSYIYRDAPQSLSASAASFGVWIAELAQHIRDRVSGASPVLYRHNVAHDGSISRLLSILQVDEMVWPGMGSEIVFEVFRKGKGGERVVRVLWGGVVLNSSNPGLGALDMVPLEVLLGYFDGLVGVRGGLVKGLCGASK